MQHCIKIMQLSVFQLFSDIFYKNNNFIFFLKAPYGRLSHSSGILLFRIETLFRPSQIQQPGLSQIQLSGLSQITRPTFKIHINEEEDDTQGAATPPSQTIQSIKQLRSILTKMATNRGTAAIVYTAIVHAFPRCLSLFQAITVP